MQRAEQEVAEAERVSMKRHLAVLGGWSLLVCSLGAGCAAVRARTALEKAQELERQRCGPDLELNGLAPILGGEAIEKWEPAYLATPSCGGGAGGCYKRLAGAVITLRALPGVTAEWLDRLLECYSALRLLGKFPAAEQPNDPFWLPGRTVDIDVTSTGKGFAVSIRSLDVGDAQQIQERTRAFVEAMKRR
jgi:hypothetical protein